MTWSAAVQERVRMSARKRLVRELCRALACGLSPDEVLELLIIARGHMADRTQP